MVGKVEVTFKVSKVKGFLAGAHNTRRKRTVSHGKLHFDVKAVGRLSLDERRTQPIVHLRKEKLLLSVTSRTRKNE